MTFGYDGEEPVLRGIDLDVEPGRTVAIVGPTGSGKTTLVMLIPRLYDVNEGAVLVDGVDVRDVDPASLRGEVAVVSDDAFLFSASLGENIAYARPGRERRGDRGRGGARRAGVSCSRSCRTASTRWSASAGSPSAAGSASAWRSPAR